MSMDRLEWLLALVLVILLTCKVALGEEPPPCHGTKTTVVCTRDGFKVLTRNIIDLQGQVKELELRLGAARSDADDAKKALDACVASIPPPAPPKSVVKPAIGYGLTVLGAAALALAPVLDATTGTKATVALGGVGGLVGGFVLVFTAD